MLSSGLQISQSYYLTKPEVAGEPGYSGNRQHGEAGDAVTPIRAKVTNQKCEPVTGIPVIFEVVDYPRGGGDYLIDSKLVPTDSNGLAEVNFTLGSAGGEYQLIARIRSAGDENVQLYILYARENGWLFFMFAGIFGGLAFFLLGMDLMSRGLLQLTGDKMRLMFGSLPGNRIIALVLGAFVAVVKQNSSAVNDMMVSFVNAKLMKFRQTFALIAGAAAGTAITAQLIAFKLTGFSLIFVVAGFVIQAFSKKGLAKHFGGFLLGFGMLFFGMYIMSEAMYPLRSYDPFLQFVLKLEHPLPGILAGALLTGIVQSSAAFTGILIIFGMQGLISIEASILMILGAGIGTAVIALLNSVKYSWKGRKVAVAITLAMVFGTLVFIWWIKPFADFITMISPQIAGGMDEMAQKAAVMPRQIANAHTVYVVFLALMVLPFTGVIARIVEWMVPGREKRVKPGLTLNYLDGRMLGTPVIAASLAKKEILRMGELVYDMVGCVLPVFTEKESEMLKKIKVNEQKVNFLCDHIYAYLLEINREGAEKARANETYRMIYMVKELEMISGVVASTLYQKAEYWLRDGYSFSEKGKRELVIWHENRCRQIKMALEVFERLDMSMALEMKYKEQRSIDFDLEMKHYESFIEGHPDSLMSSKANIEIMAILRNISSHTAGIFNILMQWESPAGMNKEDA